MSRPASLAPAWARLVIGAAAGAGGAGLFRAEVPHLVPPEDLWRAAAAMAVLGAGAALAADLDRPRPRALLAVGIGAIYGLLGLAMFGLATRSGHPYLIPLMVLPPLAARLRRGWGEPIPEQYASAQAILLAGIGAATGGAWLARKAALGSEAIYTATFTAILGAATTASFMPSPPILLALRAHFRRKREEAWERDRPQREARARRSADDEARKLDRRVARHCRERRAEKALPLARRSLELRERAFGPEDPALRVSLRNLAVVLGALGRAADAEPLAARAARIEAPVPRLTEGPSGLQSLQ